MIKAKSQAKRIFSLLMSVAMMLTLLVPTMAYAADYEIRILPNEYTLTPEDVTDSAAKTALTKRFTAYEIFKGVLGSLDGSEGGAPNEGQLADVEWGDDINPEKYSDLLIALCEISTTLGGENGLGITEISEELKTKYDDTEGSAFTLSSATALGALFKRALENAGYTFPAQSGESVKAPAGDTLADSAAVIAKVISELNDITADKNNAALADAFAKVMATKAAGTGYAFLTGSTKQSAWVPPADGVRDDKGHWTINVPEAGYYLVIDGYSDDPDQDEISKYILAVFGTQTIHIKSDAATVEKDIVTVDQNGNEVLRKGISEEIGETVTFRLTGTLPDNYDGYASFVYRFADHMSKGLTFNRDSVKVYAVKPGTTDPATADTWYLLTDVTEENEGTNVDHTGYTVTHTAATDTDDEAFTVSFGDLKSVKYGKMIVNGVAAADDTELPIAKDWKIVVEYTATVTSDAVIVDPKPNRTDDDGRNYNKVQLEYSNDVNGSGTAKTPEKTVYVYVYGEDVDKVDGTKDDPSQNALAGAGFALTKKVGANNDVYYAVFEKTVSEPKTVEKTVNGESAEVSVTNHIYTLAGWVAASELEKNGKLSAFPSQNKTWVTETVSGELLNSAEKLGGFDNAKQYYLAFETVNTDIRAAATGASPAYVQDILLVQGLEDGTYTFKEVVTPTGYDTMKDVEFTVTETIEADGNLTKLGAAAAESGRTDAIFDADSTSGDIPVTLKNMPSGYLPGTGGMGTVLFYISGAVMLTLGALYILRRRSRRAAA